MDSAAFGSTTAQSESPRQPLWIRSTSWLVLLTFSLAQVVMPGYAAANPIVDPTAPLSFQPSISATSTGVPVVNITSPNAAGTSLNQYQQFNVGPNGVVLNNSTFSGGTLLGGQVDANPNLNDGRTAITILNEVRGSGAASRSQLDGTIEVFGAPAAVIIANPNGITCHGCGVSNATGFTLSTGKPTETETGFAFAVSGSDIRIEGNGIEGTVGQIQLIGQRLIVNAPIRAHYLNPQISTISLVAGTGTATVSQGGVSMSPDFSLPAPSSGLAIDASEFGAMTSGQIQILSTDRGMGVNMAAPIVADQANLTVSSAGNASFTQLASAGDMVLDAEGNLVVSQSASAGGKLNATSSDGNLVLRGELTSGGDMNLSGNTGLTLSANTHSGGSASLNSQGAVNMTSEASLNIVGDALIKGSDVTLAGQTSIGQGLEIQSGNKVIISGTTEVGQQAQIDAGEVTMLASFSAQQTQVNADKLSLGTAGETLNISGNLSLDVSGPLLAEGDLNVSGNTRLHAGTDLHLAGEVVTGQLLDLKAGDNIQLDKNIVAGGQILLEAGNGITADGTITGGALSTQSRELTLNDSVEIGGDVEIVTENLTLPDSFIAGGSIQMEVAEGGVSSSGVLVANEDLRIQAAQHISLNQTGAGGDLSLQSDLGGISVAEAAQAGGDLILSAAQDIQTDELSSWGQLQIDSASGSIQTGDLITEGEIALTAAQGDISAGDTLGNRAVTLSAGGDLSTGNLAAGLLEGGNATLSAGGTLQTGALTVDGDALLQSGDDMNLAGSALILGDMTALSDGGLLIQGGALVDGQLNLQAEQNIDVLGAVQVTETAQLVSNEGSILLGSDLLVNQDASLLAQQDVTLAGDTLVFGELELDVQQGQIHNQGLMQLDTLQLNTQGDFRNDGLVISANDISVQARNIIADPTTAGGFLANDAIDLSATQAINLGENVQVITADTITLSSGTGASSAGHLLAGDALIVIEGGLTSSGVLGATQVQISGAFNNQGELHTGQISVTDGFAQNSGDMTATIMNFLGGLSNSGKVSGVDIQVAGSLNNSGQLSSNRLIQSGGGIYNSASGLMAADEMILTSSSLWNQGRINAGQLSIWNSGHITNSGTLHGTDSLVISAGTGISNRLSEVQHCINVNSCNDPNVPINPDEDYRYLQTPGVISSGGNLSISSGPILNEGIIQSGAQLSINMGGAALTNQRSPNDHLAYNNAGSETPSINTGRIISTGSMELNAGSVSNLDGQISAGNHLTITTGNYTNTGNNTQVVASGSATLNAFGQSYNPVLDPLVGMGTLNLNVASMNVQAGHVWYNPASSTHWTGTLTNRGTVLMAGHASGTLHNLAGETVEKDGALPHITSYQLLGAPSLVDAAIQSYTDVETRAIFAVGGSYNGNLTNVASMVYAGNSISGTVSEQNLDQTVTLVDSEGNTEQIDARSLSLIAAGNTINITQLNDEHGTLIANNIILSGQNMEMGNEPDFSEIQAALTAAQSQQLAVDGEQASGGTSVGDSATPRNYSLVDTTVPAYDGQALDSGAMQPQPLLVSGPDIDRNRLNPAPGGSTWDLELPDWDEITKDARPGMLNADNLQLNLSGTFTTLADLTGFEQLVIHAQEGIENIGNKISAGILQLSGGNLDNRFGTLESVDKQLVVDIDGDLLVQGSTFRSAEQMVLLVGGDIRDTGAENLKVNRTHSEEVDQQITQVEHRESGIIDTSVETTTTRTENYKTESEVTRFIAEGKIIMDAGRSGSGSILLSGAEIITKADQEVTLRAANDITLSARVDTTSESVERIHTSPTSLCHDKAGVCVEGLATETTQNYQLSQSISGGRIEGGRITLIAGNEDTAGKISLEGMTIIAGTDDKREDVRMLATDGIDIRGIVTRNETASSTRYEVEVDQQMSQGLVSTRPLGHEESSRKVTETLHGEIQGNQVILDAGTDLTLSGIALNATGGVSGRAGGHLELGTQTVEQHQQSSTDSFRQGSSEDKRTVTEQGVSITAGGSVMLEGQESVTLRAAQIFSADNVTIQSDGDVQLLSGSKQTFETQSERSPSYRRDYELELDDVARTGITAQGNITLVAGMSSVEEGFSHEPDAAQGNARLLIESADLRAGYTPPGSADAATESETSATADSTDTNTDTAGRLLLYAEDGIEIGGRQVYGYEYTQTENRSSGLLSSKRVTDTTMMEANTHAGSNLSGEQVTLITSGDIGITGSNVAGVDSVLMRAGGDVEITGGESTLYQYQQTDKRRSGIFGTGGFGFTIGSKRETTTQTQYSEGVLPSGGSLEGQVVGSQIGSLSGDLNIQAGGSARVAGGSQLVAAEGDINIAARDITIEDGLQTHESTLEHKFRQSGVTVAVNVPFVSQLMGVIGTANKVGQLVEATGSSEDSRIQGLAAAAAGLNLQQLAGSAQTTLTGLADGSLAKEASDLADAIGKGDLSGTNVSVTISLGSSQSSSTTQGESVTRSGSELLAGGNIRLSAEGGGDESNILVRGSRLSASDNVYLTADNDIHLLAGEMTDEQHTRSSSSSAGVGLSASFGSDGPVFGLYVEGSAGRGKADGSDLVHNNTQIQAGNEVHFNSGGDTVLRGAVIEGERVVGRVGGDLQIESLQDLSSYSSQNRHIGGSATIGVGFSAQGSASSQKINSDYASVGEQSSIRAGDGGFDIEVEGTTRLIGGAITSTDAAVEADLNRFNQNTEEGLARLELSDIQNHADYKGSGFSVSGGFSAPSSTSGEDAPPTSAEVMHGSGGSHQSAGIGRVSGSDGSITESGISGLAGNAELRTGDDESGIDQIFDLNRVQNELDTSIMVTAEFGSSASRLIGDYAKDQLEDAKQLLEDAARISGVNPELAQELRDEADAINAQWGPNGTSRIIAHTIVGALTGGTAGAAGAAGGTIAAPIIHDGLRESGIDGATAEILTTLLTTGIGGLIGGMEGGATAYNEVTNNFLTSIILQDALQDLKECGDACPHLAVLYFGDAEREGILEEHIGSVQDACLANTGTCGMVLDGIADAMLILNSPEIREHLSEDTINRLVSRQVADMGQLVQALEWGSDPARVAQNTAIVNLFIGFIPYLGSANDFYLAETTLDYVLATLGPASNAVGPLITAAKGSIASQRAIVGGGGVPHTTVQVDTSRATRGTPEYDLLNNPPANTRIELDNGTAFRTNSGGYVEEITYQPVNTPGVRDGRQTAVGKEGISGDVGGHIQACRHGGTCDRFNLFPQNSNFNNSAYRQWENEITRAMQNGDNVGSVTVRFDRANPHNVRPDSLEIEYQINGITFTKDFINQAGG